jgi:superfamily II DNA or RNA helicase
MKGRSEFAHPAQGPLEVLANLAGSEGLVLMTWRLPGSRMEIAWGELAPNGIRPPYHGLTLFLRWADGGDPIEDRCASSLSSLTAFLKRLRNLLPTAGENLVFCFTPDVDVGNAKAGTTWAVKLAGRRKPWTQFAQALRGFSALAGSFAIKGMGPLEAGRAAAYMMNCAWMGVAPDSSLLPQFDERMGLEATKDQAAGCIRLKWLADYPLLAATAEVTCTGPDELTWKLNIDGKTEISVSSHELVSIREVLAAWFQRFPVHPAKFRETGLIKTLDGELTTIPLPPLPRSVGFASRIEQNIQEMAQALASPCPPADNLLPLMGEGDYPDFERYERRILRKERKREEEEARRRETMARLQQERRAREARAAARKQAAKPASSAAKTTLPQQDRARFVEYAPLPPVPVRVESSSLEFQDTAFPAPDLKGYALIETAALWWVSNQSDDLLCLPYCRLQRLDYQVRTALRVLGPLRGRALLSDEVGLGKTIEAGLVLKELLTRGMVKRFLVLTVPSLVDQWEEELSDKFGLRVATTNDSASRDNPTRFWNENDSVVASLHTVKQPAQLEFARQVQWDLLIVDEAHYLRNRESQAWQAVNVLPRHFLLLLTATPVQNSLEELYNLVTLLQPGQLPSPKEFRARFIDPKRPRQPREPEELRRLLGQVMIRNTRANAGIQLPPRRAETVLFQPDSAEQQFWTKWDAELRVALSDLTASQAALWGRLLLQTSGSSPAAWRNALHKFPDQAAARRWQGESAPDASWQRKCQLLPPLVKGEGGAVIFTQFLETQTALAGSLRNAGIATFLINGSTPAPQRQPITEEFHRHGGALLLTHSGTEGRNLQFSHRLVNFDLPWNPMEIEQRIGRLHRIGQQHPVRIYNFVQAGTLQEHLLQILQEKLNLFELVVGETGLILGERFSSDEFAEEVLRRWRESDGRVAEAMAELGEELAAARDNYNEVKKLDETLFKKDYESL